MQGKPVAFLVCIKDLGGLVILAIGWNCAFSQRGQKRTDNGIRHKATSYDDQDQQYELLNFQRNVQLAPLDRCDVRVELLPVDEGPFAQVGLDGGRRHVLRGRQVDVARVQLPRGSLEGCVVPASRVST